MSSSLHEALLKIKGAKTRVLTSCTPWFNFIPEENIGLATAAMPFSQANELVSKSMTS